MSTRALAIFFAAFVLFVAVQMMFNLKPKPSRQLPGRLGRLRRRRGHRRHLQRCVAIGGGALTVPFLTWCNVKVHNAIGTSAAIGFPIALGGAVGYIVNGLSVAALPQWSLGFVYLPALAWLVASSMLTAPLGAGLAHRLPVPTLKRIFAGVLVLLSGEDAVGTVLRDGAGALAALRLEPARHGLG
ncbi:MAG: sulfite exporter TauE/SafE family protein [Comamonadaceae bacterium]|nr:sulfite exporter TauE/SafE family protein [Comamonadaceae bacterium]